MKARKVKKIDPDGALRENARRIALVRLEELQSFDPAALEPSEVEALHDMRIAARRLRYVLEVTEPALGPAARRAARAARDLQQLLGDIHDCDVLLERAHRHVARLRAEDAAAVGGRAAVGAEDLEPAAARDAPGRTKYRGVESLIAYLSARRALLYRRFLAEWPQRFRAKLEEEVDEAARGQAVV